MIIAIGVMFVTSLLLVAAFTVANGEVASTRVDATQKQAYFAALAGVQEYEYELQSNPDYWESCEGPKSELPEEKAQSYEVTVLPASTAPVGSKGVKECIASKPFETVIESKGSLANTFRIRSVGKAGNESRTLIATFKVSGFLDFVYYTNYETEDPGLYSAPAGCKEKYYKEWSKAGTKCTVITFTQKDEVKGPMHTNDSTRVVGEAFFGRKGQEPPDAIEINGGTYPEDENESCPEGSEAKFYTVSGCYTTKGPTIVPPESDTSLAAYVEEANEFTGLTRLVLNGKTNTISVVNFNEKGEEVKEPSLPWPKNGLIFVRSRGCGFAMHPYALDFSTEQTEERNCGTVYVSGSYSKSLTVAGENNVVINGNLYPTSVSESLGSAPTGTATLGLIASEYVRVYHPVKRTYSVGGSSCSGGDTYIGSKTCEYENDAGGCDAPNVNAEEDPNGWGTMQEPWIYAAILSTSHSFFVDNFQCGSQLKNLHVYGAIAQDYRGIVGIIGNSGYIKDYKYDGRLATDEPPYFLAPLKSGWKVIRETSASAG